jgi:hypothetical protein
LVISHVHRFFGKVLLLGNEGVSKWTILKFSWWEHSSVGPTLPKFLDLDRENTDRNSLQQWSLRHTLHHSEKGRVRFSPQTSLSRLTHLGFIEKITE